MLADVPNDSHIAQNEVFGPVLVVTPFDTEEEAIALANGTEYGLGAYVHTQNLRRAHHVTAQLQAGMIHVNGSGEAMQPNCPFGGWKQSGHGRLGGVEGLQRIHAAQEHLDEPGGTGSMTYIARSRPNARRAARR